MSDGLGRDDDFEYGRPRYQEAPGPVAGRPRRLEHGPNGERGDEVAKTAPSAVVAIVVAALGWLLPVLGGVIAIRRGNAALRVIEAAGGELDGVPLAVWARRLGWFYVVAWSVFLFYVLGGDLFGLSKAFLP
jgi:hypothetical protein